MRGTNTSACSPCPAGYFCTADDVSKDTSQLDNKCSSGYLCPEGSYQDKAELCPEFSRCDEDGEFLCQDGEFQSEEGKSVCLPCQAGKMCGAGIAPVDCEPGKFCPAETSQGGARNCPVGSYGDTDATFYRNEEDCILCPAGKHCDISGLTDADLEDTFDCQAGFYCLEGADPKVCEAGFYCPQESAWHVACEPGKFNPDEQQSDSRNGLNFL